MDDLLSQDEINALLTGGGLPEDGDASDSSGGGLSAQNSESMSEIAPVFANAQGNVLGMLTGKGAQVKTKETGAKPKGEVKSDFSGSVFLLYAKFGGLDDAPLAFIMEQKGAQLIADIMMGGEGKELAPELSELDVNVAQEGVNQILGSAFTNLSGMMGGKRLIPEGAVASAEGAELVPFADLPDENVCYIMNEVSVEGAEPFKTWLLMPVSSLEKVGQALVKKQPAAEKSQPAPAAPAPSAQGQATGGRNMGMQQPAPTVDVRPAEFMPLSSKGSGMGSSKMDLIADVPVRVTVELGRTRKNISDVLAMTPGSVIELDKMAGEPVDVLVNGKLIAKGEVVVIDENFGVRVTEIILSPSKAYSV